MAFFNEFPHTRTYDSDLGWIISRMKQLITDMETFTSFNTIKFADSPLWNIETAYEANTLVLYRDSENEITYVSKKAVPQGVNITNTDYWMQISDYNSGLKELRDSIAALDAELSADIAAVKNTADSAKTTAEAAKTTAAAAETKTAATEKYNSLTWSRRRGQNIVLFGDSWTYGSGATNRLTERYSTRLANALQMNEYNFGVGAAGFTRPGNTFDAQITTADNNMSAKEKENTGIVTIIGGVNDLRNMSATTLDKFETAVSNTITHAHAVFPDALIVVGVCTMTNMTTTDTMYHWSARAAQIANYNRSYPVLVIQNPANCITASTYYQSDNLHPNTTGHSIFASHILNAILGHGTSVFRYSGMLSLNDATITGQLPHIFRKDEFIFFMGFRATFKTAITSNTIIGNIPQNYSPFSNIYIPFYSGNTAIGAVAILNTGTVHLIPNTGMSITTGFCAPAIWLAGQSAIIQN